MAAYLAASLRTNGISTQVLDSFGIDSSKAEISGDFMLLGLDEKTLISHIDSQVRVIFVYCRTIEDFLSSERICREIRLCLPKLKIVMFENIQTVNSFSLSEIVEQFHLEGIVDVGIFGEPEDRVGKLFHSLINERDLNDIPGISFLLQNKVVFTRPNAFNDNLDQLPLPAWDLFALNGYWDCGYAHAPILPKTKFLPILTSRGCPYRCTFCVSPAINPKWRYRSAINVVDEMEYFYTTLGITDFHVSDLDPTILESRFVEISLEIIKRKLNLSWKIAQGTKIETIRKKTTLTLMRDSGCAFFSFSPETGSERLIKIMNKRFDKEHALDLTRHMSRLKLRTQACFIAGVPGETEADRQDSIHYVRQLAKAGIDEIAVSIFTPIPGAALGNSISGFKHYSELSHSPAWRNDYKEITKFRTKMYLNYFLFQFIYHPSKSLRELYGVSSGKVQTKMEMSLRKFFIVRAKYIRTRLKKNEGPAYKDEGAAYKN